jgi:putative FmdB family regulatory protein
MPVYEYLCKHCDGIFEAIKQISQASLPAPCPVCARKAQRVPPTSFSAFTMREGYPRAIPDRGTYYHLGKEVKRPITGPTRMNSIRGTKPRPKRVSRRDQTIATGSAERRNWRERRRDRAGIIDNTPKWSNDDESGAGSLLVGPAVPVRCRRRRRKIGNRR